MHQGFPINEYLHTWKQQTNTTLSFMAAGTKLRVPVVRFKILSCKARSYHLYEVQQMLAARKSCLFGQRKNAELTLIRMPSDFLQWLLTAFSALTLLVRQQEGHPICKNWVARYQRGYLSGAGCKWFAYGPADATATATPSSLALVKSKMVYLSGAGLPRLSWKKAVKRM